MSSSSKPGGFADAPMSTVTLPWRSVLGSAACSPSLAGAPMAVRVMSRRTESPFSMPRPSTGS